MTTYYNIYAVNGRTGKIIARTGAPDESTAILIACGLSTGARAFQKTAFTIVYGEGGELLHTCDHCKDCIPVFRTEAEFLAAYTSR